MIFEQPSEANVPGTGAKSAPFLHTNIPFCCTCFVMRKAPPCFPLLDSQHPADVREDGSCRKQHLEKGPVPYQRENK